MHAAADVGGGERQNVVMTSVSLRPRNIYGLRTDVVGNIHFNLTQEVIYPVEGVLTFHDYVGKKQRFLRLPDDTVPLFMIMSPNRKTLAVVESNVKIGNYISIYELSTLKKRRHLELPDGTKAHGIGKIIFTADSRCLVILTNPPDEMLYMLLMDKSATVYEGRTGSSLGRGIARCIACHPADHTLIAVGGDGLLQFVQRSEKGFAVSSSLKVTFNCESMVFIASDLLLVGTVDNRLVLVENGDLKTTQKATDADLFDILWDQEQLNKELAERHKFMKSLNMRDDRVICLTAFGRGFAYAVFNKVFVFEKISKFKYERKTVLTVPIQMYADHLYQITNLAIDSKQETIIATTKHAQIYVGVLIVPETLKTKHLEFEPLGALLHIDDIVDVAVCCWKPIIMTASKDQTIRIWNYETNMLELVRKFQVDVHLVALNSNGIMAAIGFTDQLRITQIFMDELNIVKTYNFPRCKCVTYSNYGHFMAAAYDNSITITSVYQLEVVRTLKGHNGTVLSLAWTKNDKHLISGGAEGAIYQWDVETGARVQELVQKGTEYVSVCATFNSDPISIYAATNFGQIREFNRSELIREVNVPSKVPKSRLTSICISRSDLIMFVANEQGELLNVVMDAGGGTCTNLRFFVSGINKLLFTYDGTLLIAISRNGTLSIWTLENIDGKVASMDADLMKSNEVLIPRSVLREKNDQIANLEIRLKQQAEEFQYQMSQNEIFDGQQMAEVHKSYCTALEELKKRNSDIEKSHTEEMNEITFQINDLKEAHRKQIEVLSNQYSERMLIEYQKFSNLRASMMELRTGYEDKLKKSAGTLQDTVEGLENDYKKQLDERKELIRELMKEMQDKKIQFVEYCRQVEVENDRNMVQTQLEFEQKLSAERDETQLWRGKAGVLQKKYESLSKEIENLLEEVETLKEEHSKSQKNISKLLRNIEDLQKDISDREFAISAKEKRIHELLYKNQELDKYKQVLSHKIAELKAQIEPREFQINDKRKHILEMENELAGLNQNNIQLELQLKELKDKYIALMADLKLEKHRSRAGRECIQNIRSEIYHVAGKLNSPTDLRVAVKGLFEKHASDDELKRYISLDQQVRDEFMRQRAQIERVLDIYRNKSEDPAAQAKYEKLFRENHTLIEEIDKLREENNTLRTKLRTNLKRNKTVKRGLLGQGIGVKTSPKSSENS